MSHSSTEKPLLSLTGDLDLTVMAKMQWYTSHLASRYVGSISSDQKEETHFGCSGLILSITNQNLWAKLKAFSITFFYFLVMNTLTFLQRAARHWLCVWCLVVFLSANQEQADRLWGWYCTWHCQCEPHPTCEEASLSSDNRSITVHTNQTSKRRGILFRDMKIDSDICGGGPPLV